MAKRTRIKLTMALAALGSVLLLLTCLLLWAVNVWLWFIYLNAMALPYGYG